MTPPPLSPFSPLSPIQGATAGVEQDTRSNAGSPQSPTGRDLRTFSPRTEGRRKEQAAARARVLQNIIGGSVQRSRASSSLATRRPSEARVELILQSLQEREETDLARADVTASLHVVPETGEAGPASAIQGARQNTESNAESQNQTEANPRTLVFQSPRQRRKRRSDILSGTSDGGITRRSRDTASSTARGTGETFAEHMDRFLKGGEGFTTRDVSAFLRFVITEGKEGKVGLVRSLINKIPDTFRKIRANFELDSAISQGDEEVVKVLLSGKDKLEFNLELARMKADSEEQPKILRVIIEEIKKDAEVTALSEDIERKL